MARREPIQLEQAEAGPTTLSANRFVNLEPIPRLASRLSLARDELGDMLSRSGAGFVLFDEAMLDRDLQPTADKAKAAVIRMRAWGWP